jgi:hypothetical protein
MILMMASSCSLLPKTKQVEITAKPLDRTFVQPVMPREINLGVPQWIVVTPDNWEDQLERIKKQEGEVLFLAMTVPDYEVMSVNMKELKRYITELKDVVVYYKEITSPTDAQKQN